MTRLIIFIVAQIVLGSLFFWYIPMHYARNTPLAALYAYFYFGLVASHVSLIGFWAGMGLSAWWIRALGFFAGVSGLWYSVISSMNYYYRTIYDEDYFFLFLMFIIAGVVSLVSIIKRRIGVQLQRFSDEEPESPAPKMRFTIRGLFLTTFCAALLLLIARISRDSQGTYLIAMMYSEIVAGVLITIIAALLCIWAAMGRTSPWWPTVIAIVVALLVSLVFLWGIEAEDSGLLWVLATEIFLLSHFGWTLASLLVLRSCGYRLSSRSRGP